MFFFFTKLTILGVMIVEWWKLMKDRLAREKFMGVCRWELSRIGVIMPRFPTTVNK
jgi:hypothetical protein